MTCSDFEVVTVCMTVHYLSTGHCLSRLFLWAEEQRQPDPKLKNVNAYLKQARSSVALTRNTICCKCEVAAYNIVCCMCIYLTITCDSLK